MILDTNALWAWLNGEPDIEAKLMAASVLKLNSIALGEYRFGILQSRYRYEYENRLSMIEVELETLRVDAATAGLYALVRHELKKIGKPIPYHDIWIAALARQHDLAILSRDTHFDAAPGIQRISW